MKKSFVVLVGVASIIFYSCESKKTVEFVQTTTVQESSYNVIQDNGTQKTIALDHDETLVTLNEFPKNTQAFIQQNFGNVETIYVIKEVDRSETKFKTQLKDGTKLEFSENGEWTEVKNELGKAISTTFIPSTILKYVETKYPNVDINKIEKDLKDNEIKVGLLQSHIDLKFDLDGNFSRID